jgi:hypothetical protein
MSDLAKRLREIADEVDLRSDDTKRLDWLDESGVNTRRKGDASYILVSWVNSDIRTAIDRAMKRAHGEDEG